MYNIPKNRHQGEQHSQSSWRPYQGSRSFGDGSCLYRNPGSHFGKVAVHFRQAEGNPTQVAGNMEKEEDSLEKVADNMEKMVNNFQKIENNPEKKKLLHKADCSP